MAKRKRARRALKKFGHSFLISWQESASIMFGQPITVDADETGDRYVRSPLITEVHTTTVRAHGRG